MSTGACRANAFTAAGTAHDVDLLCLVLVGASSSTTSVMVDVFPLTMQTTAVVDLAAVVQVVAVLFAVVFSSV